MQHVSGEGGFTVINIILLLFTAYRKKDERLYFVSTVKPL